MTAPYTLPSNSSSRKHASLRATFVMEQHLGHGTFYQNLRHCLQREKALKTHWVEITYGNSGAWWETLQFLPAHVRGTLCGRHQVKHGLRRQTNDIVFYNTQVPAALGGRHIRRQPYILCTDITPRQYDLMATGYGHRTDRHWFVKRYKHWVNVNLFRQARHIVPWSHWVRRSLIEDYSVAPERITVIPPGVDIERWQPRPRGQHARPVQILFVGGDFYRKGGASLLQAFHALPAGSAQLAIVTRSAIEPSEGVTVYNALQPNSPELIELYQTSDLFVLPTKAEAFGIAAVEAGAAGLPVIATDVGGVSDIVIDNHTGFLLRANDDDQLRARLLTLIEDSTRRIHMGYAARKHVETQFDARKNAARILELLIAQQL